MDRARGCPCVRLLLCLSAAALLLGGCSLSKMTEPPYSPASPPVLSPLSGPGGPLHQKALDYDRWFQERLQPQPHGGVVNVDFETQDGGRTLGKVLGYDDQQDSAIWTGTYLAAQAFRYAATDDPEQKQHALRNARRAAHTLHLFLKVTGQKGLLARFAGPMDKTEIYLRGACLCQGPTPDVAGLCCAGNNNCSQSSEDPELFWLGGTTRDQYSGWFFGMGIAYRLIDDPELRQLIRRDVEEVVKALHDQKWMIRGPDHKKTSGTASTIEPLMQAAWLLLAAEVAGDSNPQFSQWYEELVRDPRRLGFLLAEDDFDWTNRYMQYYAFNLDFLAFYNLIQLEPQAERKQAYLKVLEDHPYREVKSTGNSFFDYIALAVGASAPEGTLKSARTSLENFPEPPGRWTCVVPPKTEISRTSRDLYKVSDLVDPKKPMVVSQARKPYPIENWCRKDFLWQQSPYEICCCPLSEEPTWLPKHDRAFCGLLPAPRSWEVRLLPGADYLVAYWMGRYHHFLKPEH